MESFGPLSVKLVEAVTKPVSDKLLKKNPGNLLLCLHLLVGVLITRRSCRNRNQDVTWPPVRQLSNGNDFQSLPSRF
jgi:hypothetical protein